MNTPVKSKALGKSVTRAAVLLNTEKVLFHRKRPSYRIPKIFQRKSQSVLEAIEFQATVPISTPSSLFFLMCLLE